MIASLTAKLVAGERLNPDELERAAEQIFAGGGSEIQVASFLTALAARGETIEELTAFATVMRRRSLVFKREPGIVLDTCGTGGDHSGTFNISTAAAFVAAAAGVRVAKHGNRSMTSKCGSADVLHELGIQTDCEPAVMERSLDEIGICFLFAQKYHQSMRNVAVVRRELGFRTIFNLLGPLANPASATHQLIGVFRKELVETHAEVLRRLGIARAMVVHGEDGLDEITICGKTHIAELVDGKIVQMTITPGLYGIAASPKNSLQGGDAAENARITMEILQGNPGPKSDVVILNAGAAIYIAEQAANMEEGIARAREILASGAALEKLNQLRALTNALCS
jgi:anthranilate phosphoribosyltransferase